MVPYYFLKRYQDRRDEGKARFKASLSDNREYTDTYISSMKKIEKSIAICGVCKNVGASLPETLDSMERTGKLFSKYKLFVYENNSTDNTKKILTNYRAAHPDTAKIIIEDLDEHDVLESCHARTSDNRPCRMENIARSRNIVLSCLSDKDFDYVLWVDMDLRDWNIDGVLDSLKYENWDCITANGLTDEGDYRDSFAYRDAEYPFGPELLGEYWWKAVSEKIQRKAFNGGLCGVYSAFGGMAIYRSCAISKFRYSGIVSRDLHSLYLKLMSDKGISKEYTKAMKNARRPVVEGCLTSIVMYGDDIAYVNNSGYNFPVTCEHVTLHASMILHGFDKIYVNPKMMVFNN
jgi:glycosyltransferase involved in cell wall biosynthesis